MKPRGPVWRLAAATAAGYLLVLVAGALVLFVLPYVVVELG